MPDYHRAYLKGGTFFFTVVTYKRYTIFKEETAIDLLRQCFQETMAAYPFWVDAYVILPDHLHIIWTLPNDDSDFSIRWKRIKGTFSRHYQGCRREDISESIRRKKEKGIWQRRFWEHLIRDQADFNRLCDYIHYNPVKHGLTSLPVRWKHSSFRNYEERGFYSQEWGQSVSKELFEMDFE